MIGSDGVNRIVVATRPVDFRKGHDGLAAVAEHELGLDPHSGVAVIFRSKSGDRLKLLAPSAPARAVPETPSRRASAGRWPRPPADARRQR